MISSGCTAVKEWLIGWNLVLLTHKQEKHFFKDTYSCNLHTHTSTWIYLTNQNHETNELTDYTGTYNNIYRPVYGTVCTGIQLHISYPAPIRINLVIKLYIFKRTKNEKKNQRMVSNSHWAVTRKNPVLPVNFSSLEIPSNYS